MGLKKKQQQSDEKQCRCTTLWSWEQSFQMYPSILVWQPFQRSGAKLSRTTDRTTCLNSTLLPSTGQKGPTRHGNATYGPVSRLKTSSHLEYQSTERERDTWRGNCSEKKKKRKEKGWSQGTDLKQSLLFPLSPAVPIRTSSLRFRTWHGNQNSLRRRLFNLLWRAEHNKPTFGVWDVQIKG